MASRKRWAVEEEKVLTDQITRNAHNLAKAFKEASRILETRTVLSCKQHWYYTLSKKGTAVCFTTIGYRTRNINRKVVSKHTSDNTEKTTVSWWRKLLKLLKE